jgi:ribosome-binding factor A
MKEQSSHRVDKVADLIRREISMILIEKVRDPRVTSVTITQVRMSADLKEARIYFDWCGGEKERHEVERGLNHSAGFIRRELAHELTMKTVPRLIFFYDETREIHDTAEEIIDDLGIDKETLNGT